MTSQPIKKPPVEGLPTIVVAPPDGSFNVIRPSPPQQWVAVELPPSLMNQIMEQVSLGKEFVTMTPEMFKEIWEMTHFEPRTSLSPTGNPPIEHGPVKGPENPPEKVISEPILPPGKGYTPPKEAPPSGGESRTPPREERKGPPIWLPMMGGSLAPAPGASTTTPNTNQQRSAIRLP
jgi:hypothetical protein